MRYAVLAVLSLLAACSPALNSDPDLNTSESEPGEVEREDDEAEDEPDPAEAEPNEPIDEESDPDPWRIVADPVSHDPTQIVAWDNQLIVWSSGSVALGVGQCPLISQHLRASDEEWQLVPGLFPSAGPLCDAGGDNWPDWLADEDEGGGDFDAPGAYFDPEGRIPDAEGEPTQSVALYYSLYYNGSDETGQACLGRVTAREDGEGEFPDNLVWEDDGRPVLCSNTPGVITEVDEAYADPSAGVGYETEGEWVESTNEALGLDAEVFEGFDGGLYMVYGSHAPGMIKVVQLDPATGRLPLEAQPGWTAEADSTLYPTIATGPLYEVMNDGSIEQVDSALIEAPFIYPHDGYYYLFVNWFRCCAGENSTYQIVVGRSESPLGPYVDKNGQSMATYYPEAGVERPDNRPGGETFLNAEMLGFETHRGPGHPGVFHYRDGDEDLYVFSFHYYPVGGADGGDSAKMGLREMAFDDGWPFIPRPKEAWSPAAYFTRQ